MASRWVACPTREPYGMSHIVSLQHLCAMINPCTWAGWRLHRHLGATTALHVHSGAAYTGGDVCSHDVGAGAPFCRPRPPLCRVLLCCQPGTASE